ncbi:NAD(P)-binding domain-containing protein [Hymenobacter sp. 5317J-9]|uniref:NAD(P)-binding domain-containing protein n=1 Tax=Hymenobacter sp. 5317J-9 TaxID=2932250 RepID=UPI001FD65C4D|nr:NAD(P)-binding domain-containing protein [Hymenobacter sp. 5317J-9]UOQ96122.1 NAD(P)-binding domain-containing protein [Hymenobacter sp. 5317J-9]
MTSSNSGGSASTTSGAEHPTVLVLGCGWLGMALARALAAAGHEVLGTTTTPENLTGMEAAGIQSHLLRLGSDFNAPAEALLMRLLRAADVLVLNVPPRAAAAGAYPSLLRPVHRAVAAAGTPHVLFVSSTSVYPNEPRLMREADALSTRDAASDVLRAEGHFVPRYGQWKSTVVRLGGLMGPDRSPGRFLAGRRELEQGNAPVNLVHLTDVVGVLSAIIRHGVWGHTFNVCAEQHPPRRDFYPAAARYLKLEAPTFKEENNVSGKTIDSSLVRSLVPYTFQHDDVLAALEHC